MVAASTANYFLRDRRPLRTSAFADWRLSRLARCQRPVFKGPRARRRCVSAKADINRRY